MPNAHWLLRISLAALGAMLILPFLNPHHFNPIPTFYQEWTAAACGLFAATLLLAKAPSQRLEIPEIALLPLGLTSVLLLQWATSRIVFLPQALIFALYLLWGLLILTLGRSLRQQVSLERLATLFSAALLGGALLESAVLILQLFAPPLGLGFIFSSIRGSGNLAQANHLADYLWLGLASGVYLYTHEKIGRPAFILLIAILLPCASLTGSRSIFFYAAEFALLSLWAARRFRQPSLRRIAGLCLLLVPLTIAVQLLLANIHLGSTLQTPVSGERLFHEVSGTSQRLQLWRTGLAIYAQHPWLGAGIGQFPSSAYILVGAQPDGTYLGGGEHAHNLFIQLLAEFGPIAPALVVLFTLRWWFGFIRQEWSAAHWWIAAVLLVLATHSQLEYPLWYTFFLGIAALLLGIGSDSGFRPRLSSSPRVLIALILLLGAATLTTLIVDYGKLERTLNGYGRADENYSWKKAQASLDQLHRESLFSPYVELSYAHQLIVDKESLKDKIAVCEMAIRFSPIDSATFKLAYLLALDGRNEEAKIALQRAVATHPQFVATALRQLASLSEIHPETRALLDELRRAPAAQKAMND